MNEFIHFLLYYLYTTFIVFFSTNFCTFTINFCMFLDLPMSLKVEKILLHCYMKNIINNYYNDWHVKL